MKYIITILLLLSLTGCEVDSFTIKKQGLFPEGMAFDKNKNKLFVSSVFHGSIYEIDLQDKQLSVAIEDSELVSSLGVEIDEKHNRLLVCNSDPGTGKNSTPGTTGKLAQVRSYDLKSGRLLTVYNLSDLQPESPHLANDLALDRKGNIYVTDSFSPNIYKIDLQGQMSIFTSHPDFAPSPNNFGLNGLVVHPDGFLIVAKYEGGQLFKVPLDNPKNIDVVLISEDIPTIDGILLKSSNELYLVSNALPQMTHSEKIFKLRTSDHWSSAVTQGEILIDRTFPTSLIKIKGQFLYLETFLSRLFSGDPNVEEFGLKKFNL